MNNSADVIQSAKNCSKVLAQYAFEVDNENRFPFESVRELQEQGFMGLVIPAEYGGLGQSLETMVKVARILSGACLSTGMIWGMHCQQLYCIIDHGDEALKKHVLPKVCNKGELIGSVTSEKGKGGHLLSSQSSLLWEKERIHLYREAPTVTAGEYCDSFLVTMRKNASSQPNDVYIIYIEKKHAEVTIKNNEWYAMGMRGTQTISLSLSSNIHKSQIINIDKPFNTICYTTMIPIAHIMWAACWLGASQTIFRKFLLIVRGPGGRKLFQLESDSFKERISRIRMNMDIVDIYLSQMVSIYDQLKNKGKLSDILAVETTNFNIKINNLKILASELLYQSINDLVQICGMEKGYISNAEFPLERILRDLRSATLMFNNNRLLSVNGTLTLLERSI